MCFLLDVPKAYDTLWRNGLWLKLWDMGVKGRMWRVIKKYMRHLEVLCFWKGRSQLCSV